MPIGLWEVNEKWVEKYMVNQISFGWHLFNFKPQVISVNENEREMGEKESDRRNSKKND